MEFYKQARDSKGDFDAGVRAGVARVSRQHVVPLSHRAGRGGRQAGTAHPVSDVELASRLFFCGAASPIRR